jgi:hypothetical protein
MKKFIYFILFICAYTSVHSQSSLCGGSDPFCSSAAVTYPAGVDAGDAENGPDYGCLNTQPNPAWFYMQLANPGDIAITITASPAEDIDFILYGPFTSPTAPCNGELTAANTEDCSYLGGTQPEIANITGGLTGQYYILLLTNYSNDPTDITFQQTSGTGSTSCAVLCDIATLTATPSSCDPSTNTYSLSGQLTFTGEPTTGTLTVTSSCGGSQTFNPPFTSPLNYNIGGITSNGSTCTVTASFSSTTCSKTTNYTSPIDCTPCVVTANNSGPVCEGSSLTLMADPVNGATSYTWTGPAGYLATSQNPVILSPALAAAGTYSVTVTTAGSSCSATTTVIVNSVPVVDAGFYSGICAGDSITLGGNGSAGTYVWNPGATLNDSTILTPNASPAVPTNYTLTITNPDGCSAFDTVTVDLLNIDMSAGPDQVICTGATTTLNATGGTIYSWYPSSTLSDLTIPNPIATPTVTTTYTLSIYDGNTGCSGIDSVTVTINPLVIANAGTDKTICFGDSTTLGASGGVNYSWSPASGLSNPSVFNPAASPAGTTTYTVIVSDAAGCLDVDSMIVNVNQLPVINAGNDASICFGTSAPLNATGGVNYLWSPGTTLTDSTISNPLAAPDVATTYSCNNLYCYGH